MKKYLLILAMAFLAGSLFGAESVTGIWKSIDENTNNTSSISMIYEYDGLVYGRILVTYDDEGVLKDTIANPVNRAENIEGEPFYAGLDFIWGMKNKSKKWSSGKIIDPKVAKIYSCDMWKDGENLVVRGKLGPFGRNQTWLPVSVENDLPEGLVIPENCTPVIPRAK